MILTRRNRGNTTEQVIIVPIRVKLIGVNHASLGDASAAVFISRLSHFKLLDHEGDGCVFISLELLELLTDSLKPFLGIVEVGNTFPLIGQNDAFADLDMLPLGVVYHQDAGGKGGIYGPPSPTHLTHDERTTLMTLALITRAPLIFGGRYSYCWSPILAGSFGR